MSIATKKAFFERKENAPYTKPLPVKQFSEEEIDLARTITSWHEDQMIPKPKPGYEERCNQRHREIIANINTQIMSTHHKAAR